MRTQDLNLTVGTWVGDLSDQSVVAYQDDMPDDLLIHVNELGVIGDTIAITLFNVKLLDSDFQERVWDKLREFKPGIQQEAQKAGLDLRGVLLRIMETGFDCGHISDECLEFHLSLLEGWRGSRLMAYASDKLIGMIQKQCGSQQASGKIPISG